MAELVLQLQDIDEVGKDYAFELTPGWLDQALADSPLRRDPAAGPGRLQIHAQKNGAEVLVDGEAEASLLMACSRCLNDAPLHVHADITALLSQDRGEALPEELELETEDLDRARFAGHEIVLDELVREHLLLECPMQPLCSPECPGIEVPEHVRPKPEDFGGEGQIDPRLLPLKRLRAKLSGDKE
jgi:uncharacterized protein